ncbi:FAD-dependent monooxygenase [Bradyrhizobium sp. 192]|uniref:FAD-dependent monooxygenase n=1 Tax=Bradyrhizobium sp. 192 TaxID=2782660 RepID=UPI001FFEA485|nr:FAD-dependent monooxygenase [Bradyrhizobium sp. 192]UPJ56085.1 FAD-dependent monooxygenase [Bradyrhizobium sp. 192]
MRDTDIAIIGGGLGGSTAAAMLGRADISSVLFDPHESYPADFRVEKLSGQEQLGRFSRTGIAESVLRRATFAGENWIARFGRLLDKAPSRQFSILYDSLVNAGRDEIPASVERICAKAMNGMDADKIAAFYADPVKRDCDQWAAAKAFDFRSVSIATNSYWTAQRSARFMAWSSQGLLRRLGGAFHREPNFLGHSSSSSSSSSSSRSSWSPSSSSLPSA